MSTAIEPERQIEPDGAPVDVFALPHDEGSLEKLLRGLFTEHWRDIIFGPLIQGAAWEIKAAQEPELVGMMDGYLTIAFGVPHFHICIGEHKGTRANPVSPECAPSAHRARRAVPPHRSRRHAGVLGASAVQRQRRAADHRAAILRTPDWSRLD